MALPSQPALSAADFTEHDATFGDVRLHYRIGGFGVAVVLLHGFAETGHMWHPVLPLLSGSHTVIVPDLRGAGDSSKPDGGYDKATMAQDIWKLLASLDVDKASIVGHDIGMMVAYAYAAQFPDETEPQMARTPLRMPVRVIAGKKSGGTFLIEQVRLVAEDVKGTVIPGSGHWLLEEAPEQVVPVLLEYVNQA